MWFTLQHRANAEAQTPEIKLAPARYALLTLDEPVARASLALKSATSSGGEADNQETVTLPMPLPDGTMLQVRALESTVMAPELAQRYPHIKTYTLFDTDKGGVIGAADLTDQGFHAMFSTPQGTVFVDPRTSEYGQRQYLSYYKHDYRPTEKVIRSMLRRPPIRHDAATPSWLTSDALNSTLNLAARSSGSITTYRLALAATGEYTSYHGGINGAISAMVTTISRVNAIYERDLAVRMELIANNHLLVYNNAATDPYDPSDASALLSDNQSNLDAVIGNNNYDIGHVFSTEGGGLANLGVVCLSPFKAQGETGSRDPIADPFDIDYVAHEIGHQFGANHTFNGTTGSCGGGNRWEDTAFEPGSGSSIMAYAGICGGENLQSNSDAVFHAGSIFEINTYLGSGVGASCGSRQNNGNTAPSVSAGADFTIPKQTPFFLTGSANDANVSDSLTYAWEEIDLGTASTSLNLADDGSRPLFRSFEPSSSATRYFPKLTSLLSGTSNIGERLPTTSRSLKFRLTVRDQVGGVADDDTTLTVDGTSGPFRITSPNGGETINGSTSVTWDVAGTHLAPVSCSHVNIGLSIDGGLTQLASLLAANVPNNGVASVSFPAGSSNTARIKVQCANSIFFDVSDANFSYTGAEGLINQTISFSPMSAISIGVSATLSATSSSGLPVTFRSDTPTICGVNESTVTGSLVGLCTVTANQAGNATYATAPPVTQSFAVDKASQTIATISFIPDFLSIGGTTTASATATSGMAVSFSSTTPSTCSVLGNTVSGLIPGICTVAADQSGSDNYAAAPQITQSITVTAANPTRLLNIATRGRVETVDNVMIAGFIIQGSSPKKVLIRARGPSLAAAPFNVPGTLSDPFLTLYSGATPIDSNDDFAQHANAAQIPADWIPANAKEAAIVTTLNPGAYTAIVNGVGATSGVAIVEVFEIDQPGTPLINIATRGPVYTGDNVMIAGLIIQGDAPKTVLITARGPSMAGPPHNVPGTLSDPVLTLYSGQTPIASNDNWVSASNASQIQTAIGAPSNTLESAILITLQPGAYTAIVNGANNATGLGIVEVFAQ